MVEPHPGLRGGPVYLDYNATTPVDPRVFTAMVPYLTTEFGNPSSKHQYGGAAHAALDAARTKVGALIGAPPEGIVFTGSGSEADAMAIRGVVMAARESGVARPHVITQVTEHPAVLAACHDLETALGATVTYLPVDQTGRVSAAHVQAAFTPDTVLVSIMHANNETGTLQPITEISAVTRAHGALLHSDAAQSLGKTTVDVDELGVDLLTIVGHKMYAPKGIGALYVRPGVQLRPLIGGGGQERGLRAGTENVAYAAGLGEAATLAQHALDQGEPSRLTTLRDLLETLLHDHLPGRVHLNGHPVERLPNTLSIRIDDAPALRMLADMPTIAASAGSACHSGRDEPSPVLTAMGLPAADALASVRLSLGRWSTEHEVRAAALSIATTCTTPTS